MGVEGGDELVCVLVTDLVGWTELGDRIGDDAANGLRQVHFADVRALVTAHQGREIKTAGDSVLATFRSALQAIQCAEAIQRSTARTSLHLRIGIDAGEPIAEGGDVFGTPVNVASRLCAAAGTNEVLVSDLVRTLVGRRSSLAFEDAGPQRLKGLREPVRAFRVGTVAASPEPPARIADTGNPRARLRPERAMLCPILVGRLAEQDTLAAAVDAAAGRHGRVALVVGEAGVGKSRLAKLTCELGRNRGLTVLSGRCVPGASPVPYRPLTEAFVSRFRDSAPPTGPELVGFEGHLRRLVPQWRATGTAEGGADESPVLLGEAVVRLTRLAGASVLLLEDLHWADLETVAVVEYLADALREEPVLCLCTTRPDGRAIDAIARLRRNDGVSMLILAPLPPGEVERFVAACLETDHVPGPVREWIGAHSEGNPFLIEELLAGLAATGTLVYEPDDGNGGGWTTTGDLTPSVPFDFGESVRQRLQGLDPTSRRVLRAAALLGRRFDWELLPGVAEVDGRAVVDALRAAVDAQIVVVDSDRFTFRHALTREAVLGELLPPERRDLATRAWPAVERANPGLPGAVCELAADLAEAAGQAGKAAERLVESAHRALASGAFFTAEATAERARRLAPTGDPVALAADDVLVRILAAAGKPGFALDLGARVVERLPPGEARDLRLVMARAALAAGEVDAAARHADAARAGVGDDRVIGARVDAIAAYVALDQARLADAAALARTALDAATATGQPAVACEALEVLGRVARVDDPESCDRRFQQAADLAAEHGLASWQLRARHELALRAWGRGDAQPLRETRELAARTGALITQAVMDLSLADIALSDFDRKGCLAAAKACVDASRRYGLATESVALLWLAGAQALAGDEAAMQAAAADALARDPNDPRILGDLHGRVHATRAFVADDLGSLRGHLDTMMEHVRRAPPTTSIFPGRGLWAIVHAMDDDDLGAAAVEDCNAWAAAVGMLPMRLAATDVEAVSRGRRGEGEVAAALFDDVWRHTEHLTMGVGIVRCQQVLVAMAALRDGWGDPIAWLREAEAFFAAGGYEHTARRCRILIGEAGAPVPRRRREATVVPPSLRALGVTSRELDVLELVTAGLSTKAIADRLYLSPKTVERHLANLFDRMGVRNRGALADLARTHGLGDG